MGKQTSLKRNDVISASEISQYIYCSIAWNLQRHGHEPISPLFEAGKKTHVNLGKKIDKIQEEMGNSKRFAIIGYLFLIFAIIFIIYGVVL
jgi:hypothetical protein